MIMFIPFGLGNYLAVKSPDGPHHNSVTKKQELCHNNKPKLTSITKSLLRSSIRSSSSYKGNKSQTTTPEHPVVDVKEETETEISSPSQDDKKNSLDQDDIHLLAKKVNSAGCCVMYIQ